MMQSKVVVCAGAMALAVLLVFGGGPTSAQVKKGKTQLLETKNWMKGVNGPHCTSLKKLLDAGPSDEKTWSEAAQHAQILNESGHVLMADGRCPDKVWADAAKQLREGSAAVMTAIDARNTAGAQAAFGEMVQACGSCHKAHKK
jgi:cytochrome c556